MKLVYTPLLLAGLAACTSTTGSVTDATTAVADPNPTVVNSIAAMDLDNLAVGEGVKFSLTSGTLAPYTGTTVTKIGSNSTGDLFLSEVKDTSRSDYKAAYTQIHNSDDLKAYYDDANTNTSSGGTWYAIGPETQLASSAYRVGAVGNAFDGTHKRVIIYIDDQNQEKQVVSGYQKFLTGGTETSRSYFAINYDDAFTAPVGTQTYTGRAMVGKEATGSLTGGTTVGGVATMSVDFGAGTGTLSAPTLTDPYTPSSNTGSLSSAFTVNNTTGTFTGSASATLNTESGTGTMVGTFNGDGTLAAGVANINNDAILGVFAVSQ